VKDFSFTSIIKSKKGWLSLIALAMVFKSICDLIWPRYLKYVFDSIGGAQVSIQRIIVIGLLVTLGLALSLLLENLVINLFVKNITFELNNTFIESLLNQPVRKLAETGDGKILTNFSQDINSVSDLVRNGIDLIRIPFQMILASAYLIYTNAFLGIIMLALLPPVALIGQRIGKSLNAINQKYLTRNDIQLNIISRVFKTINVIKAYASEKPVEDDFGSVTSGKYELDRTQVKYSSLFTGLIDLTIGATVLGISIMCAALYGSQNITVGTMQMALMLSMFITQPFTRFNNIIVQYKQTRASFDRLADILTVEDGGGGGGKQAVMGAVEEIRFADVSFKYRDRVVINKLDLLLNSGKHYAVIGENGSGKTTFIKLLLNVFSPDSGIVAANGIGYRALSFQDIRSNNKIVYIEDDPCALFDNFDKNITLGGEKDEGRFAEVLQTVGLYDQYPELSCKSADELSAGQKQRLAIARGLYHLKNETVLVMDEPFSALDANGSGKMRGVFAECKNKYRLTIFEITHNLNDMDRFDYVYYFEDGKVLYEGTHAALMEQDKYRLYVQSRVEQLS
jgi:ABC-type multidrug transport system fused ATPase/permease subunit